MNDFNMNQLNAYNIHVVHAGGKDGMFLYVLCYFFPSLLRSVNIRFTLYRTFAISFDEYLSFYFFAQCILLGL